MLLGGTYHSLYFYSHIVPGGVGGRLWLPFCSQLLRELRAQSQHQANDGPEVDTQCQPHRVTVTVFL